MSSLFGCDEDNIRRIAKEVYSNSQYGTFDDNLNRLISERVCSVERRLAERYRPPSQYIDDRISDLVKRIDKLQTRNEKLEEFLEIELKKVQQEVPKTEFITVEKYVKKEKS